MSATATATAVGRIGQAIGLTESERPEVITGPEIATLSDEALRDRLRHIDLCARLQPVQKLRLLQMLRQDVTS